MTNITQNIKNICRKKFFITVFFIIIMILILIIFPFLNIFHPTTFNDIFKVESSNSYVNVTAETLYYSGYNLIKSGHTDYGYYYALKNDQCVFVIIPIDNRPQMVLYDYKFKAKVINPDKPYQRMLSAFSKDLNWNENGLSEITSDFVLSNANYHPVLYTVFFCIVLVSLLISVKALFESIVWFLNPTRYPVCGFGGKDFQTELIHEAQKELINGNYTQMKSMYITENYFIDFGKSKISIIPFNKVIWCYRFGTVFLNIRKSFPKYSICFMLSNGKRILITHKTEDEFLALVDVIRTTDYNIIIGYSEAKRKRAYNITRKNVL